jgi:predicted transcriptional regulator
MIYYVYMKEPKKEVLVTARLDQATAAKLEREAARQDRTVSYLIRKAVEAYLK